MENKTLIGKENHLFLINDSAQELNVHCNNLNLVIDEKLSHLNFEKYLLTVFPNKSLYYKKYLPDNFIVKYRPALEIYKNILKDKIFDSYDLLKNIDDAYYKTDTHINLKGNYNVYLEFIKKCNNKYNMNLIPKQLNLKILKDIELSSLNIGIGDLTWGYNLGNQQLDFKNDNYYYSDDIEDFYMKYTIKNNDKYIFYNYELENKNEELENKIVDWNIISKYIIYKNNIDKKNKVIIFYDSFLLSILPLYMELFKDVYMIKNIYNNELIDLIKPDYVFEFRVERFLL
jgi:hypothetical protein